MFLAPFGDGLNAPPSNEDIARVVTGVLSNPAPHIGKNYRPTGPTLISPADVAGMLGNALGRKITYKDIPFKMFTKAAVALGFPLSELAHFRYYADELKSGAFAIGGPTDHVLEVSGEAPEDFESIARRYVKDTSLIHPALKLGSKLGAVAFLMKMMATPSAKLDAWERDRGYPLLSKPVLAQDSTEWRASAERQELNLLTTPHLETAGSETVSQFR